MQGAAEAAVAVGDTQLLQQAWGAQVQRAVALAAGLVAQGAGQPGFAGTGRAGQQQIVPLADPVAAGQAGDQALVQGAAGAAVEIFQTGVGVLPVAPQIAAAGSPDELLRRRPDLIAAERRLAASNARIGIALAEYYPKLFLSGLIGSATSVSRGNLFSSGASQTAGVLGLRWRLFDFGRIDAQIDLAKGQEAEILAAYRLAVLHATEDVVAGTPLRW